MLEQATANETNQAMGSAPGDETLLVRFYPKTIKLIHESERQGKPCYEEKIYIDIRVPGERSIGVGRPVRDEDKQRFPRHWAAYEQRMEAPEEGTPLSEWAGVTRSEVEELSFQHVKTVETLANLSDTGCEKIFGGQALKQRALLFLEQQTQLGEMAEKEELLQRISELEALAAEKPKKSKKED